MCQITWARHAIISAFLIFVDFKIRSNQNFDATLSQKQETEKNGDTSCDSPHSSISVPPGTINDKQEVRWPPESSVPQYLSLALCPEDEQRNCSKYQRTSTIFFRAVQRNYVSCTFSLIQSFLLTIKCLEWLLLFWANLLNFGKIWNTSRASFG